MLTDEQADEIRRELDAGARGPVLLKWVRELFDDRDERLGRSRPTRTPVRQAASELGRSRNRHKPRAAEQLLQQALAT